MGWTQDAAIELFLLVCASSRSQQCHLFFSNQVVSLDLSEMTDHSIYLLRTREKKNHTKTQSSCMGLHTWYCGFTVPVQTTTRKTYQIIEAQCNMTD